MSINEIQGEDIMRTKSKTDKPLGVAIIVVVALLAFILTTIIYCVHYMYAVNTFKRDVQYSMAQTKKGIGIEFSYDDEVRSYNEEDWNDTSTCYTINSLSVNKDVVEDSSYIPHKMTNGNIAYDMAENIYNLWDI